MSVVKISRAHDKLVEDELERIEEKHGVRGTKKKLVEDAIEELILGEEKSGWREERL